MALFTSNSKIVSVSFDIEKLTDKQIHKLKPNFWNTVLRSKRSISFESSIFPVLATTNTSTDK